MKKFLACMLCGCMAASLLTGCGGGDGSAPAADAGDSGAAAEAPAADAGDSGSEAPAEDAGTSGGGSDTINVWAFTDEVPGMIEKYIESHPEFGYKINTTIIATTDGAYQPALDQALAAGGAEAPDLYCAEAAFVLKYTQGDASQYAMPYADMGIDVDAKLKEADIAQYTVDIGTNTDGQLVGLGYQATGGAFIYRRSIAQDVWGTDDPAEIEKKIGPGWDQFFTAAEDLKAKGYGIVSGDGDMW
ncbi:MAG: carbohydrate ABC transporter substrate-binding protein, partial [Lachnospiraceae bacterium]|nr:carbohydrate ABC transporter substrate-binding protein [Lachnospiraceae bacterium]